MSKIEGFELNGDMAPRKSMTGERASAVDNINQWDYHVIPYKVLDYAVQGGPFIYILVCFVLD